MRRSFVSTASLLRVRAEQGRAREKAGRSFDDVEMGRKAGDVHVASEGLEEGLEVVVGRLVAEVASEDLGRDDGAISCVRLRSE